MSEHLTTDQDRVEPEGLNAGMLGVVVVGGLMLILAATFIVVSVTELVFHEAKMEATTITGYPNRVETEAAADNKLNSYGLIDRDAQIYRIPIDRAMELIVTDATAGGGN